MLTSCHVPATTSANVSQVLPTSCHVPATTAANVSQVLPTDCAAPAITATNMSHVMLTNCHVPAAKAHLLAAKERQAAAAQSEDATPATDKGGSDRQDRGDTAHYLQDVKSSKAQMRRPTQAGSLSWRCALSAECNTLVLNTLFCLTVYNGRPLRLTHYRGGEL